QVHDREDQLPRVTKAARRAAAGMPSRVWDTSDWLGDAIGSALAEIADRFRGGARSVGEEAARLRQDAARLGTRAVRRLSVEVEQRPLVLLAVAAGIGLLIGLAARRRRRFRLSRLPQGGTPRSRRLAPRSKDNAWLATAQAGD